MGTTPAPVLGVVELVAKKRGFDLDKMERVSEEVKVTFVPVKDFAEATERIGGDEAKLVNLLNIGLRREALKNAKASHEFASGSVVGGAKTVNQFVNAFRLIAPFNSMQDRKAQTAAVCQ